ncbi:hypothetical protein GCM10008956_40570 [Deinococcus arenae]|uniref:Uncharacterized protein n=1 Tax=Deinococcus arenae TaxID=1452751 RepID=A0A8H9LAS2_9DEIO|nr:hypothetical protein [Deinococcus arenae]GGM60827.1 hypothetical protein GCM10008956_40570 [Deinococcus arenae]
MQKDRFWCAFVVCSEPVNNQIISSFLSFYAGNRFLATKKIEDSLPDNPKWENENGTLRPYEILSLQQCKPEETSKYAEIYMNEFRRSMGLSPNEGELEITSLL